MSDVECRAGLWRVAHRPDPLEFVPHDRYSWGHRFDDLEQRHRTLYCAETPETALREVLADLRPNAAAIAKHRQVYGAGAIESLPKTSITERWREENLLAPCVLLHSGRLLDLVDPRDRHEIEVRHAQLLADHGMSHLDMHEITTRRRIVTQTIATDAYNNLGVAAIRFASSRDGHGCIALFEGRAELHAEGDPIALTDPPPTPLVEVAADWGPAARVACVLAEIVQSRFDPGRQSSAWPVRLVGDSWRMSAYVTGAAISATSAALGYGANALRERGVRKEATKAARATELHQALREYMAALDAVTLEVEDLPAPLRETAIDRWVERRLKGTPVDIAGHLFARWLKRHAYGGRHDDLSDRLVAAAARLRLVAPPQVEALMRDVEALAREHPVGDPQLMEHWRPLRERIRQEFKGTLDY